MECALEGIDSEVIFEDPERVVNLLMIIVDDSIYSSFIFSFNRINYLVTIEYSSHVLKKYIPLRQIPAEIESLIKQDYIQ